MIIAVDFDGILADTDVEFPDIGTPNYAMLKYIKELMLAGHEVILWTSRTGQALSNAITWCYYHGMDFETVNDNAPSNKAKYAKMYPQGTRKVHADIYIDDHNPGFMLDRDKLGLMGATQNLITQIKEIVTKWGN